MTILEKSSMQLDGPDGNLEFEVDPDVEMFRVKVGKEWKRFKKSDLWSMIFVISDPDQQDKMIPVRRSELVTYTRIHRIKLKKDMKQGQEVKCKCEINVEKSVVEGLRGLVEQNANKFDRGGIPIIGASKLG